MDDKGLDIKVVVQRFAQSTEALDKLSEKLASLTSSSESMTRANESVNQASVNIQKVVDEFLRLSATMRDAGSKVEEASNTASRFLSQTDLSSIERGLDSVLGLLDKKISDLEIEVQTLTNSSHKKDLELAAARSELQALKNKWNAVPEKQRKKIGL
jgi:hypothetical protein